MLLMDWNIEWMNNWFSGNAEPEWGSRNLSAQDAKKTAQKVANVIRAIGPDILCLQEGPSSMEEMQLFLTDFLSTDGVVDYVAISGKDGGAQKLYVLYKRNGAVKTIDYATDQLTEELSEAWMADVDGDLVLEPYDFTRLPLIVDVKPKQGQPFRIVVLHTKSKYVHNGQAMFADPARRQQFISAALKARRRISAEGFRLRTYLDKLIEEVPDELIVVTGDWNDGPGPDFFERQYLTHNVADIVLGSTFYPNLMFVQPIIERVETPSLFTARFDDFVDGVNDRPLLLDHFAISPALNEKVVTAYIAHEPYEAELEANASKRSQRASDHRPIVLEIASA